MSIFDHFKKPGKTPETSPTASAAPQLKDFHPYDTGLSQAVMALSEEFNKKAPSIRTPCSHSQFIALLAGICALRKTPGIPGPGQSGPGYFTALPRCTSPETEAECRAHLKEVFGITDKPSLLDFCKKDICCNSQYLDFVGFWEGHPPFDLARLDKGALEFFQVARDFSAQFYPIVGHKGYLAWDISECVGHLRTGYACGLLTREDLEEMAGYWIAQAQVFNGWADFAVSLVCGELYWDFRHGSKLPELNQGLDLWTRLIRILLDDNTAWGSGMWYVPTDKTGQ
ncbi:MAG: DUF1266 domain-containing protein [Lachnospiraceae bacterium]|nr:DUF1266 domain-containing protein [Lachnospiraceae bacterium]